MTSQSLWRFLGAASVMTAVLLACPVFAQAPTPAPPPASAPQLPVKFIFNGYVQGRYSESFGDNSPAGAFNIQRAYVNLRAEVTPKVAAGIMVSGVPSVSVKEAFGEYKFSPALRARIGLYRIPFGYEMPLSSSRLITLERSQVLTDLLYRDFTFDRGVFAYYTPVGKPVNLSAAVVNGASADLSAPPAPVDPNDHKNIVARLGYAIPGGQIGVSVYDGIHPTTNATMDRTGYDIQVTRGNVTFLSEGLLGRDGSVDKAGAYVTLAYQQKGKPGQPYLRYDTYDPDRDSGNNNFERITVGYNHYLNDNTKLTLEYQSIDNELQPDNEGAIAAQYQVSF